MNNLGTNVSVCSWIDVTVWNILIIKPTIKEEISIGALHLIINQIACTAISITSPVLTANTHLSKNYYHRLNELTKLPTTKFQPSAKINNKILNGIDMVVGGSIIIPIDINTDEITISITINGM